MIKKEKSIDHDLIKKTAKIYQSITRDSMDGFLIVDMQGQILDVNDSYCRLIGYSRTDLLKKNISDIAARKKENGITKHLQKIKKIGEDRFLMQHRKKDGTIINIEASANYANYLGGFVFIFIRDVTARNKTENTLKKNREKSKKIIEDQLSDSYKHLGLINRKISLLLELGKIPKSKKDKKAIIDHILNLAMNISRAPTGYLYGSKKEGVLTCCPTKVLMMNKKRRSK